MALLETVVGYGPLSTRPAPGATGALFFTSDTGEAYRDNGTAWDLLSAGGLDHTIVDSAGSLLVAGAGNPITTGT